VPADLSDLAKFDYLDRVNRAIDHILRHLDQPLRLPEVSRAACFSPYHFHRIFRAVTGETVHSFVKRARLERAVQLMSYRPRESLTDIASACGFSSSSEFSRSFREHYGVPPSGLDLIELRRSGREQLSRVAALPPGENPNGFAVRLRQVPTRRVAYLRVFRPYSGGVPGTAQRLVGWARERGLHGGRWLGYQWDDPEVVPLDQCRYDIGLEVPADAVVDGEVSTVDFPAMTLAEVDLTGPVELELLALDWLYKSWLPTSGFVPDDAPCFEAWHGLPFADGVEHLRLRVQLAVVSVASAQLAQRDDQ
jgi:AraC family transcriptional regulator